MIDRSIAICFWNKCNNHCLMCTNPDDFWKEADYSYAYLENRLGGLKGTVDSITVTGGEPTIHPDFLRVLDFIKKELPGVEINLLTNGRRLCYDAFTRSICALNKINIAIALHGYDSATHDRATAVKGSFEQACAGIRSVLRNKRPGQAAEVRVVVTRLNYRFIDKILRFIDLNLSGVDRVVVLFMEIEGEAEKRIKQVGFTYAGFRPYFAKIKAMIPLFREFRLYHFPLCVLDQQLWKYTWLTLPKEEVSFAAQCQDCWCRQFCLGAHKGYLKAYGAGELSAPKKSRIIKTGNHNHPISHVLD